MPTVAAFSPERRAYTGSGSCWSISAMPRARANAAMAAGKLGESQDLPRAAYRQAVRGRLPTSR